MTKLQGIKRKLLYDFVFNFSVVEFKQVNV